MRKYVVFLIFAVSFQLSGAGLIVAEQGKGVSNTKTTSQSQTEPFVRGMQDPFFDPDFEAWSPFEEMQRLRHKMNRFFRQSMGQLHQMQNQGWAFQPSLDIYERDDHYLVEVDLPGMQKDQINVEVTEKELTISGERRIEKEIEKEGYFKSERAFGAFQRTIPLPEKVIVEKVTAKYENGVLTVKLPKAEPVKKKKSTAIPIQ